MSVFKNLYVSMLRISLQTNCSLCDAILDLVLTSFNFCGNATLRPKVDIFISFFKQSLLSGDLSLHVAYV